VNVDDTTGLHRHWLEATQYIGFLSLGVTARVDSDFAKASQALAAIRGRDYVIPDDIRL